MKSKLEARAEEQKRLYRDIIKIIAIEKAIAAFGDRQVTRSIVKYLESIRERNRLLKDKYQADERLENSTRDSASN
jgi:hypothetical protein